MLLEESALQLPHYTILFTKEGYLSRFVRKHDSLQVSESLALNPVYRIAMPSIHPSPHTCLVDFPVNPNAKLYCFLIYPRKTNL